MYDYMYLDESIAIHQPLMEAIGGSNLPQDGDVWLVDFPYYLNGASKERRVVFIDDPTYGLIAIRVSTIKPNTYIGDYNYVITDPLLNGFTKPVYLEGTNLAQLKYVNTIKQTGVLDTVNYNNVKTVLNKFIRNRYLKMFNTLDWLLYINLDETKHASGNNNNNRIQNIKDVERTRSANCMDIANIFHMIATKYMINHYIVQTVLYDGKFSTPSHWYVVFVHKKKWRYIHYIPGIFAEGTISDQKFNTADEAINAYTNKFLLPHFGMNRTPIHNKLGRFNFRQWDIMAKNKSIQKDIINALGWKPQDTTESYYADIDDIIISNDIANISWIL